MKHISIILLLFSFSLSAQKDISTGWAQNSSFLFLPTQGHRIVLENQSEAAVKEAIFKAGRFAPTISLQLVHNIQSKAFSHYHYEIYKDGKKIVANKIYASVDKQGLLRIQNLPTIPNAAEGTFPAPDEARKVQAQYGAHHIKASEAVYYAHTDGLLHPGLLVQLEGPETLHWQVLWANGEVMYDQDLHKHHTADGPNDSLVSVAIFEPDPLTTAQQPYGAPYADADDNTNAALEAEQKIRTTLMTYDNGQYRAQNDYVKIRDFSLPNVPPASSASRQMHYTRDASQFEDINVVYHITNHRQHLASLGYPALPSYQIEVDPHALSGSDDSFFSTSTFPFRLYMGEGGVDDAEDADIILHEFSHAVIYEASPSFSITVERGCIEEALCDYFAASYSASISSYNAHRVFNWDSGEGVFWAGRSTKSEKYYGALTFKSGYYAHTDILASCLMTLYDQLGRNKTDELVLEALFHLTGNTTMPDFAGYMTIVDTALYGGAHAATIIAAFAERHITPNISLAEYSTPTPVVQVYNTYGFALGEQLLIEADDFIESCTLYNMNGQKVHTEKWERAKKAELHLPALKAGAYVLSIRTASGPVQSIRLLRF